MPVHARPGSISEPADRLLPPDPEWTRHYVGRSSSSWPSSRGAAGAQTAPQDAPVAADHWRCEQLLADLTSRLVTLDAAAIDDAIADGVRRIGETLQVEWAAFCRAATDDRRRAPVAASALLSLPSIARKLEKSEALWVPKADAADDAAVRAMLAHHGIRSVAIVPLAKSGRDGAGPSAIVLASTLVDRDWTPEIVEYLRLAAAVFSLALARKADGDARQAAAQDRRGASDGAAEDTARRTSAALAKMSRLSGCDSAAMRITVEQAAQVAPTPATVLLLGETGVGKEVLAQAIHDSSPRRHRQMIRVSCAAIPNALIESELFGRERGAFTGAITRQIGRFEAADQSTLFLDEIGDLPADVQVKLLRVLQERVIERLGSTQTVKVDVRIIAATNRNLEQAVADKSFREDLFYRLNVFPIQVPPLRQRVEDVPALAWTFVDEFSRSFGKPIESISKESMQQLQAYPWPGNVRELRNVIERAVILATDRRLTVPMPQLRAPQPPDRPVTLASFETDHIRATLERTNWRIRGQGGAAQLLGLKPTTLESRMAKLGLVRPDR
jgi:transcriptional regulator with GAF, ATPase, and Fis domain